MECGLRLIKEINSMFFQKCIRCIALALSILSTGSVISQTIVDVPCTGPVNPNSGRIYDASTKSYGYLYSGVS